MPEQLISVDRLRIGMFINLHLKWYEHPFIFSSFKIKDESQIQTLKELGLTQVGFVPEKSESQPHPPPKAPPPSSPATPSGPTASAGASRDSLMELKQERIRQLRERKRKFSACERQYDRTFVQVQNIMKSLMTGSDEVGAQSRELIHDMVGSFLAEKEIVVQLMNAKSNEEGMFYHTLNVAILAMMLGKECGLESETIENLAMGALFHDIGKSRVPKKVLLKQTALTPPEKELLQLHTRYGEEIAMRIKDFPEEALQVIRQHHETMDGKGYPHQLQGGKITIPARITAIANAYDTLCNPLNVENAMTPHEALSYMFRRQQSQFDPGILATFIRYLGVYPPGTVVGLSNELIGLVVSINPKNQLQPGLLLYDPEVSPGEAYIIDMGDDPDLKIVRSIRPSQLSPEVYQYLSPRTRINYYYDAAPPGASVGSRP
ncbi:MAG: HD-GYP domain-containing protein [Syntrophobacteraceae bacterium]|nr:HD-GYP domain-containing protein [Desulfobacteraceae bacterium]